MYTAFEKFDKYQFPDNLVTEGYYSGNNEKSILVVAHTNKLMESDQNLLNKILGAKEIDLKRDICLLKLEEGEQISLARFLKEHGIKHLFLFGVNPKHLGLNIEWKLYKKEVMGELAMLVSHSLPDMAANQDLKRNLWENLKAWEF